jgi:hypothetical protein
MTATKDYDIMQLSPFVAAFGVVGGLNFIETSTLIYSMEQRQCNVSLFIDSGGVCVQLSPSAHPAAMSEKPSGDSLVLSHAMAESSHVRDRYVSVALSSLALSIPEAELQSPPPIRSASPPHRSPISSGDPYVHPTPGRETKRPLRTAHATDLMSQMGEMS